MAKIGLTGILGMAAAASLSQGPGKELPSPQTDLPAPAPDEHRRFAVFAGGCFWCVEAVFEQLDGVIDVVSGYAGDSAEKARYDLVSTGTTRHAEAVRIEYDPHQITYGQLLRVFFATHDPTTKDRQGPDFGPQYRSAIFYSDDAEKAVAEAYIAQLNAARVFPRPIVTTLEPLGAGFFPAENYHQDFARLNPLHPYIRQWSQPKVKKVREAFPDQVRRDAAADAPATRQAGNASPR